MPDVSTTRTSQISVSSIKAPTCIGTAALISQASGLNSRLAPHKTRCLFGRRIRARGRHAAVMRSIKNIVLDAIGESFHWVCHAILYVILASPAEDGK